MCVMQRAGPAMSLIGDLGFNPRTLRGLQQVCGEIVLPLLHGPLFYSEPDQKDGKDRILTIYYGTIRYYGTMFRQIALVAP